MSKETIWKILREAEEHQMQSDRWADERDEWPHDVTHWMPLPEPPKE